MCPPIFNNVDGSVMPQPKQIVPCKFNYLYSCTDKSPYVIYSDKSSVIHFSVLSKIVSEIANADILSKRLDSGKG